MGYERPISGEFYDDNWLTSKVEIAAGSFSGSFSLSLTTQDFSSFLEQLEPLYNTLQGKAKFATMEGQIEFSLSGNGRGGIEVSGQVMDQAGIGNRLEFNFSIDQTYIPSALNELRGITKQFPIRSA